MPTKYLHTGRNNSNDEKRLNGKAPIVRLNCVVPMRHPRCTSGNTPEPSSLYGSVLYEPQSEYMNNYSIAQFLKFIILLLLLGVFVLFCSSYHPQGFFFYMFIYFLYYHIVSCYKMPNYQNICYEAFYL